MVEQQFLVIICPHCGWKVRMPVPVHEDGEMARVAADIRPLSWFNPQRNKAGVNSGNANLNIANSFVDRVCPNQECKGSFLYNRRTGETRL